MGILFANSEHYGVIGYLLTIFCCVIFFALVGYYIPLIITIIKFNKLAAKEDGAYTIKRKLTVFDEGIKTQGEKYNLLRNWESITGITSNDKFIYITLADKKSILLPKRHFSSQVDVTNFIGLIESYIIKTKGRLQANAIRIPGFSSNYVSQKSKPPYLLGLLCVIPVVGVFVGLGLLIYGVFVYRDKWLSLIGLGGILFTFIAFYLMKPSISDNDQFRKLFAESDKTELNSLVKALEFYKSQNGSYPDNLQQLDIKGSNTSIDDPLLSYINGKGNYLFNYHKIGQKYTIFSSGIDQKPNTADDIYPTIDTSKTGLIIPMVQH